MFKLISNSLCLKLDRDLGKNCMFETQKAFLAIFHFGLLDFINKIFLHPKLFFTMALSKTVLTILPYSRLEY